MVMKWCLKQPKIELHAHLNGSVRDSTLLELAKVQGEKGVLVFEDVEHVIMKDDRSLVECFKLFDLIHVLTTDHETVTRITKEVVEDFASENTVYIELRTTPKKNAAIGMTKRSYMEAVIDGLRSVDAVDVEFIPSGTDREISTKTVSANDLCNGTTKKKKIIVRFLLSIDRRETTAAAMETVKLALELRDLGIVGIDLSGNPLIGEWDTFLPALQFAREQGLPVTLHCGEVLDRRDEVNAMLDFHPQRIGHACCIDEEEWRRLKLSKIPIEICLTSNIRTLRFPSIEYHHFIDLYNTKYPVVICTDDMGVFSTSLSHEYHLAATAFGLGEEEMFLLARNAVDFIFAEDEVKKKLREIFDSATKKIVVA